MFTFRSATEEDRPAHSSTAKQLQWDGFYALLQSGPAIVTGVTQSATRSALDSRKAPGEQFRVLRHPEGLFCEKRRSR